MDTKNRSAPIYMGNAIPPKESAQYIKIYCTVARSVELWGEVDRMRIKIVNYLIVWCQKEPSFSTKIQSGDKGYPCQKMRGQILIPLFNKAGLYEKELLLVINKSAYTICRKDS